MALAGLALLVVADALVGWVGEAAIRGRARLRGWLLFAAHVVGAPGATLYALRAPPRYRKDVSQDVGVALLAVGLLFVAIGLVAINGSLGWVGHLPSDLRFGAWAAQSGSSSSSLRCSWSRQCVARDVRHPGTEQAFAQPAVMVGEFAGAARCGWPAACDVSITQGKSVTVPIAVHSARHGILGAQIDFGQHAPPASAEERTLMSALTRDPAHIDEVVRSTGLAAAQVSATLALLELKGLVRDVGGMQYVRVREDPGPYAADREVAHSAADATTESEPR